MHEASLQIATPAQFRLNLTVWVLRRRAKNLVDRWQDSQYSRVLVLNDVPVRLTASMAPKEASLTIRLYSSQPLSGEQLNEVKRLIQRMFGLAVDLKPFYAMAATQPGLDELAKQFYGVQPTRYPTLFEALVNAVACQQVSLDAGIALMNRLSEKYGLAFSDEDLGQQAFPRPEELLRASEDDLRRLGFSYQKARTIKDIAFGVVNGNLQLEKLEQMNNQEASAYLQTIRGIGRWSAEYVLLRGLGRLDVFPGDDVGGQNNLRELFHLDARPDYNQLQTLATDWGEYAGLVYFHLLLSKLGGKGLL